MIYYIKRIFKIDYRRMFKTIKKIAKRSNKSFIYIFYDVIKCSIKFGSGYMDYYCFSFEKLDNTQRATYITRTVSNEYIKYLNDKNYYYIMEDKPTFLNTYKNYIKRDYLDLRNVTYDDFKLFIKKHQSFMAKPIDGLCGNGVELIDSSNYNSEELYKILIDKNQLLIEELIIQHSKLNELYPEAINTIRVVTCNINDNVSVLFKCLRMGNNGAHVDNFNHGGLFAPIDDDGIIRKPACDKDLNEYEVHPYTNTRIIGFNVPMMDEIYDMCFKMAKVTKEIAYCGFDIALSENGPCVVECNEMPGYDLYQYYAHLEPKGMGLKPKFDKIIYNK